MLKSFILTLHLQKTFLLMNAIAKLVSPWILLIYSNSLYSNDCSHLCWCYQNVSVVVIFGLHQVHINADKLQGILNWNLYLIYGVRLLCFRCPCLMISHLVFIQYSSVFKIACLLKKRHFKNRHRCILIIFKPLIEILLCLTLIGLWINKVKTVIHNRTNIFNVHLLSQSFGRCVLLPFSSVCQYR